MYFIVDIQYFIKLLCKMNYVFVDSSGISGRPHQRMYNKLTLDAIN